MESTVTYQNAPYTVTINQDITTVRKGDIVRFKAYALRVETEPTTQGNFTVLSGRISVDGCPFVTKKYLAPLDVTVERAYEC